MVNPKGYWDGKRGNDAVLEAHGVYKRYGRNSWALVGVDAAVRRGSITALVGPNAAGKSTLIKTWVGFERPTRGEVRVVGVDPWVNRRVSVAHLGYVPQSASLVRGLTVEDHLALALLLRRDFDRVLARRRIDELGIPLAAPAQHLSGGQQAQVALALALGTRAQVLLLDEPLANLDPLARREALSVLVQSVQSSGSTALLSSHSISDVEESCDHLIVLGIGRTLLDEPVSEAVAHHRVLEEAATCAENAAGPSTRVAAFADASGQQRVLLRITDPTIRSLPGRAASLQEVVLGYLTAGRPLRSNPGEANA